MLAVLLLLGDLSGHHGAYAGTLVQLESSGAGRQSLAAAAPGSEDLSEFMAGSVAVGLVLVESRDGPLNWTSAEESQTIAGFRDAFAWWALQEPRANLTFKMAVYTNVPVSVEPTQGPITTSPAWVAEALSYLGYANNTQSPILMARDFANDLRRRLGTDWAVSIFVADSDESNLLGVFSDIQYEKALIGGPYGVMSRFSSWAWNWQDYYRVVPAHILGHLFYATDEYDSNLPESSGYLGIPDQNGETGIMNRNDLAVGQGTRGQIAWVDSDMDGILDVLDTEPLVAALNISMAMRPGSVNVTGAVEATPLLNRNPNGPHHDVTIARIASVETRVDNGTWVAALPADGVFDGQEENFTVLLAPVSPGNHWLEVRAVTSVGNLGFRSAVIQISGKPGNPNLVYEVTVAAAVVATFGAIAAIFRFRRRTK